MISDFETMTSFETVVPINAYAPYIAVKTTMPITPSFTDALNAFERSMLLSATLLYRFVARPIFENVFFEGEALALGFVFCFVLYVVVRTGIFIVPISIHDKRHT
jgi:hypothetical protein